MATTYQMNAFESLTHKVIARASFTPITSDNFTGYIIEAKPPLTAGAQKTVEQLGFAAVRQANQSTIIVHQEVAESFDTGTPYNRNVIDIVTSPIGEDHPEDRIAALGIDVTRAVLKAAITT